jgi:hypothetical protein
MKLHIKILLCAVSLMGAANVAAAQQQEPSKSQRPLMARRHFGIPIFGPDCRYRNFSPYCDYAFYRGPIFIDGVWVYGGSFPHRYWAGRHQFWYQGRWRDGAWGHGGRWGGHGGYMSEPRH